MKNSTGNTEIQYLRSQIAALEQLLEVYEKTALEQADKLYGEISERQKAGKAIKASEQFLQTLLDSIPAPVFYKDTDGKYTGCNRAFEDFLGMNKEEIIGKTVFDVAPEEIAACYYEADKVLFQSKGSQVYEAHVRLRNGSARDVIFHKAVFYDLKGTLVGLIGIILDITDRKRVEDSLRKSEASLANAQRIAHIGNWEWDIGKNRLWWSDETYCIFGLIRQTFAATYEAFLDSVHPDDREFVKKAVNESLDEKKPHNIDFRIILPDGSIRFIHGQGEVSFDNTGKVIRMNGTVQDVTEQKKAEEELQEFSNFNQTLVGSLPFGMDIVDEEGNILYVSKRFETLLGKKIIGEKCWNTYRDNKKQCDNCFLKEGVRTGKTETVESEGIFGGKVFQITHVGLVYKGKKAILEIFNDITGLKQAEKELRLRHKELLRYYEELEIQKGKVEEKNNELEKAKKLADEASHAKGEFLANMSHEIRTPMNGVIGMTDLLLDTELTQEQHEYAETIRNCANSLLSIIDDILDFSKIEAGKLKMENIDFDLSIAMESIIDILVVGAEKKGLEFSCFIDPEVPSFLRGDPGRLRQVLINLGNNAIKFTKDGEVAISVTLDNETDSHATIRFIVKDTGIGIPADRIKKLFHSFSQVDSSTTRMYGGTGLGLAISKQLTGMMGGQIGVESEEGKGSTFWFTVILEKQPSVQQRAPYEPGVIGNMRVLVVDDNQTNRRIFRAYLESWRCRVEEAVSAEEAMKKLHEAISEGNPFQIALIDRCMPKMDGESLSREIRADPQLKDLILAILTSVGMRGDAEYFKSLGFAAYLLKPVKQSQLYGCLSIITGKTASARKDVTRQTVTRHSLSEGHKRGLRILVAEDNVVNQKVIVHVLEKKLGYIADIVANGKKAIESLERSDYHLVLMDCQMPEVDGYEATRIIRNENSSVRNHNIPIIAMTANALKGDRERCLEAGMNDYVTKPVNMQMLADAIKRNLHDGIAQSSSTSLSMLKESENRNVARCAGSDLVS